MTSSSSPHLRTLAVLATATASLALPSELFDASIATKLRATYTSQPPVPSVWPQYTTSNGTWRYFGGDTWTTGFFPATMYAMAERAGLCPELGLNASEWVGYGRASSSGEIPGSSLSVQNQARLEHDVGFVSFPFQQELIVLRFSTPSLPCVRLTHIDPCIEIRKTILPVQQSNHSPHPSPADSTPKWAARVHGTIIRIRRISRLSLII